MGLVGGATTGGTTTGFGFWLSPELLIAGGTAAVSGWVGTGFGPPSWPGGAVMTGGGEFHGDEGGGGFPGFVVVVPGPVAGGVGCWSWAPGRDEGKLGVEGGA